MRTSEGKTWRDADKENLFTVGGDRDYTLAPDVIYASNGSPIFTLRRVMPRIEDAILDCVFYLYPSAEDADRGEAAGGTGFSVTIPSIHPNRHFVYAITNRHVIDEAYSPVIRLNSRDGGKIVFPFAINHWVFHEGGDDLAAALIGGVDLSGMQMAAIDSERFITRGAIEGMDIGPGDEVYMVGRFVHHEGKVRNMPSVRSGIISVMPNPDEGIEFYEGRFKQEAFLIEMRSISGYSGSPVIFQVPLHISGHRKFKPPYDMGHGGPWLLGVDCGNFRYWDKVFEVEEIRGKTHYRKTNLEAKSHAGQAIVIPAWRVLDLLDQEEFAVRRKEGDKLMSEREAASPVERDALKPKVGGEITPDAFEEALKRASRKVPQPDSEAEEK